MIRIGVPVEIKVVKNILTKQDMRKVILAMQMSLDGFIEGPNGEMDWLVGSEEDWKEMFKDLESVDTPLLGRKMYPGYAAYWRSFLTNVSSPKDDLRYAKLADKSQHIVFSKTLTTVKWKNTRIAIDPLAEINQLKKQPGNDIVIWGGSELAATFINLALVDRYRITLNPTILGGGKPMFNNISQRRKLKLLESRPMKSGATILWYEDTK
jgi:dihydrofolate reductase